MTDNRDESRGDFSGAGPDDHVVSDRVQELTWAMLDEQINDDEFILLENLLLSDESARGAYVGCTQLHADLMAHFAVSTGAAGSAAAKDAPVLGFLGGDTTLGLKAPSNEEAMQ